MGKSFSSRLSQIILLIVSILFIVMLGIVSFSSHALIAEEATKGAGNMLKSTILEIEKDLGNVESTLQSVAWMVYEHQEEEDILYLITHEIVNRHDNISGSAIAFVDGHHKGMHYFSPYSYRDTQTGEIRSLQLGNEDYNYFEMEWFKTAYSTKHSYWSEPYFDEGGGEIRMSTFSMPLFDPEGKVFAVITADIAIDQIQEKLNSIHPYEHSYVVVASRSGKLLNEKDTNLTLLSLAAANKDPRVTAFSKAMMEGKSGYSRYLYDGIAGFVIYGPLENGWSAAISCQYRDVLKRSSQMHLILIIVGLIGIFIMFLICYRTILRLTRPITELSVSALNMAKGNFQARLPEIKSKDEMMMLHDSFLYMQKSLTHYIQELKTTTAQNERMEGELNVARNIQMGMLSRDYPENLYAFLEPAKEVGGDLYDFFLKDKTLYFAIGDVSGKGVPASLVMAITRAAFRFIAGLGLPMDEVISKINDSVSVGNKTNMFVTLFAGRIDLETGECEYCNAGHNPIIVLPPDEEAYYMKAKPNLAVGLFEGFPYQREELTLKKGTRLLLYTDGVSEAENRQKELYGDDRLIAWARQAAQDLNNQDFVNGLYAAVKTFTAGNEANDDITIMSFTI